MTDWNALAVRLRGYVDEIGYRMDSQGLFDERLYKYPLLVLALAEAERMAEAAEMRALDDGRPMKAAKSFSSMNEVIEHLHNPNVCAACALEQDSLLEDWSVMREVDGLTYRTCGICNKTWTYDQCSGIWEPVEDDSDPDAAPAKAVRRHYTTCSHCGSDNIHFGREVFYCAKCGTLQEIDILDSKPADEPAVQADDIQPCGSGPFFELAQVHQIGGGEEAEIIVRNKRQVGPVYGGNLKRVDNPEVYYPCDYFKADEPCEDGE